METKTDPGTGIRYHQIRHDQLRTGDRVLPWNIAHVETTGEYTLLSDPTTEGADPGHVAFTVDKAGTVQRPAADPIRIRERVQAP